MSKTENKTACQLVLYRMKQYSTVWGVCMYIHVNVCSLSLLSESGGGIQISAWFQPHCKGFSRVYCTHL